MNARVTRRVALAAGVTAAAGIISCARKEDSADGNAPVPKGGENKSWVGKTVMPKKPDPVGIYSELPLSNPDGTPEDRSGSLGGASWEVKAEKGGRVQVFDVDGFSCWVKTDLLLPLANAVEFYTKAIESEEKDFYPYNFRGWAKYLLGKPDDAIKDFDKFIELVPPGPNAHRVVGLSNRGLVLAELGKFDAALKDLDEAIKFNHLPAQINRGWMYELKGEYKKALADYTVVGLQPVTYVLAMNNWAWLLATCPDATIRDGAEAVHVAKRMSKDQEGMFLDTLAAAHAEAGDFAAAVKAQELALEDVGFAKKYGDDAQKRLQLYKDKKPYRSTPRK
jgi:tetratricopeptide (TPR) repeat protein